MSNTVIQIKANIKIKIKMQINIKKTVKAKTMNNISDETRKLKL